VGRSEAKPHQEETKEVGGATPHPTPDLAAQVALLREEVTALRTELTEHRRSAPMESPRPLARDQALVELRSFESLEEFVRAIRA
jgi:hypothetical protein